MTKLRRRPVLALVLLAVAVFLVLGDDSGALGRSLAGFSGHYFGQLGTMLVVLILIASAYFLGAPVGAATKIAHSFRERRYTRPPARIEVVALPEVPVVDRRKANDVRCAMKSLGYLKHEYDPVVAGLNLSLPLDQLVRGAIKELHKQKVLS